MANFWVGRTLIIGAITMIGMTAPGVALAAPASLAGSDQTKTLDCAGGPARIAGAYNKVTLSGDCTHLTILGSRNTVTADFASGASIWFGGSKNEVTWTTADGKEPHVRHFGVGNTLKKKE